MTRVVQKPRGAKPAGVREELQEMEAIGAFNVWLRGLVHETPSWLTSMIFHVVVLLVLALLTLPSAVTDELHDLVLNTAADGESDELDWTRPDLPPLPYVELLPQPAAPASDIEPKDLVPVFGDYGKPPDRISGPGGMGVAPIDLGPLTPVGGPPDLGPDRRRKEWERLKNTEEGIAVARALKWLAEHQWPDGGWSFDHTVAPTCRGQCRNVGSLADARVGATAMALLPFLGAGQTHTRGKYRNTVRRGLYFLVNRMRIGPGGGSLYEEGGRMYSHGIAAIALCEAYALTGNKDKGLRGPAQQALNFICYAQDPVGGGWRYQPRQRGDTSVVGWQIMALKSGHMAYLLVPQITVSKASFYLDGVQYESGSKYGYTDPGQGSSATTAIGLLCRMYLGWKKDNPALQRGVAWLSDHGPSRSDMYYDYYATQVMRHFGGELWRKWDAVMKPHLVDSQATGGHEAGSWHFKGGDHGAVSGGRLYCTAMAAMTLEVYYRHLPIYARQSVEDDFVE